jgi:ubiquitin carboxyl-terminal hydrolase 14
MSAKYAAIVIWGKEKIEIEIDPSAGVAGLKAELQARSGVPSERMKVMPKSKGLWKGVLKDTEDLTSLNLASIAPPISMLMMGSATLPIEPVKKTVFLEDLPPEMAAQMVEPSGLVNLGNTCYLNSVTQCLRVIPHLRDGLKHYTPGSNSSGDGGDNRQTQMNALLLKSLLSTLDTLDRSPAAISPQNLVMSTKMA